MNDNEIDELIAAAAAVTDSDVDALDLSGHDIELLEAIMSTGDDNAVPLADRDRHRSRRGLRLAAVAAGTAAAAVGALLVLPVVPEDEGPTTTDKETTPETAWAAHAVEVAEAAPRLLVTSPGWEVETAAEFDVETGMVDFTDGENKLELTWYPLADDYNLETWLTGGQRLDDITIAGRTAAVVHLTDPNDEPPSLTSELVAVWEEGTKMVMLRGEPFTDPDDFLEVLSTVEEVSVEEWLSAMPEIVVKPAERAAAVEEMLQDIPVPEGFDTEALAESTAVSDRYQLGAEVTLAVSCAWFDQWADAKAAGDTARQQEAVDAMATSFEWDILQELASEGGLSGVVWQFAVAMGGDGTIDDGRPDVPLEDAYPSAFGCEGSQPG